MITFGESHYFRIRVKKLIPFAVTSLLLAACSPHPGAGKWQATGTNDPGIAELTLSYDGKAQFTSRNPAASWHCFWSGQDKSVARLDCTPSSNPDREERYLFRITGTGEGELLKDGKPLGRFKRVAGKPEIP